MKFETQSIRKLKNMFIKFFFLFLRFSMNLYDVGCQDCQNKWLSKGSPPE
jgi:hypothetical protein